MPKLIDVHTHVHFAAYKEDREAVIDRALTESIWMVNVGTQGDTSRYGVEVAEKYEEGVYATVGLHPIHTEKSYHDVKELGDGQAAKAFTSRGEEFDYEHYKKLGKHPKVVAIGECGLDYYRLSDETKTKQAAVFETHIELASELKKPLMIHCRSAFPDLIEILERMQSQFTTDLPGIIHFFTGSVDDARRLLELGFYFSFGGVTTFTRDYDDAIKAVTIDRIVLESDAPYVAPVPYRGRRNEPSYITYVADALANVLEVDKETIAAKTTQNARRVLHV